MSTELPAVVPDAPRRLPRARTEGDVFLRMLEKSPDMATFQSVLAAKEQYEAHEARKAFNEAFAAFKAEAVEIIKNRQVTDGPLKGKKYAELYSVVNAVTPALSKHGLSASWKLTKDEKDWIEVTCTLRHVLGHSESVSMSGPPDAGGAKNAMQARASTVSYLERYTLKAICGVAEQGDDTDANSGGMGEHELADHYATIDAADSIPALMKAFGVAWKAAEAVNDTRAMKKLGDRKEARKKALSA